MKQLLFFISILLAFSCSDKVFQKDKVIYEKEEIKALNDVFLFLFGEFLRDGYTSGPPPKPLPPNASNKDSLLFEKALEFHSLKFEERKRGIIDTSYFKTMKLYVSDTLIKFSEKIDLRFPKSRLLVHAKNTPRRFNLSELQNVNAFKIRNLSEIIEKDKRVNGLHFIFSRILFNKNYNLGYFSYDSYHHGAVVTIEKINNKWIIKEKKQTWVE